jgi:hypothetical protein
MPLRILIALTSGLLLIIASGGCKKSDSGSGGSSTDEPKGDGPKGASGAPDISISPAEFRAEFARNGQAAMQKFKGKVIELTGVVAGVGQDPFERAPGISLKADGMWTVSCVTTDPKPWLTVSPGSTVKLKGTLPTAITFEHPTLANCQVTSSGGKPPFVTATQLTKECASDIKAAHAKYNEKWVNLEGEILNTNPPAGNDMIVRLKGEEGYTINCAIDKRGLESAKPSQKLKVFGNLFIPDAPGQKVLFIYASALTELK